MPEPLHRESADSPVVVEFVRSDIVQVWDDRFESLLDFAGEHGVEISAGCRYGDCGTCLTELLVGEVTYNHRTGIQADQGYCLPCSCRPRTSIKLDV